MIVWYEDNSNEIVHTVDGSGSAATVTATLYVHSTGEEIWSEALEPTGTDDEYAVGVHPADVDLSTALRYRLRIVATYDGATLESEEVFRPRVRRT